MALAWRPVFPQEMTSKTTMIAPPTLWRHPDLPKRDILGRTELTKHLYETTTTTTTAMKRTFCSCSTPPWLLLPVMWDTCCRRRYCCCCFSTMIVAVVGRRCPSVPSLLRVALPLHLLVHVILTDGLIMRASDGTRMGKGRSWLLISTLPSSHFNSALLVHKYWSDLRSDFGGSHVLEEKTHICPACTKRADFLQKAFGSFRGASCLIHFSIVGEKYWSKVPPAGFRVATLACRFCQL